MTQELLLAVSHYITIALENAKLYDDLKVLDKAKERVINHLSHELRTPLAVLAATFRRLYELVKPDENPNVIKNLPAWTTSNRPAGEPGNQNR